MNVPALLAAAPSHLPFHSLTIFSLSEMNVKTKIALHSIMQKVSRGIITQEQAPVEFKKLTGQDLEDLLDDADKETGKFLAYLETAYPEPKAPKEEEQDGPESQLSQESTDAPAVPVDQPKRTRQAKPKAEQ